jgi:hypothetical protein
VARPIGTGVARRPKGQACQEEARQQLRRLRPRGRPAPHRQPAELKVISSSSSSEEMFFAQVSDLFFCWIAELPESPTGPPGLLCSRVRKKFPIFLDRRNSIISGKLALLNCFVLMAQTVLCEPG